MAQPAQRPPSHNNKEQLSGRPIFDAGTVLAGRWRIVQRITEGGFGQIYQAVDTRSRGASAGGGGRSATASSSSTQRTPLAEAQSAEAPPPSPRHHLAVKAEPADAPIPVLLAELNCIKDLQLPTYQQQWPEVGRSSSGGSNGNEADGDERGRAHVGTKSEHFLRLYGQGVTLARHKYIVMELAGRSMREVKKSTPSDRLPPAAVFRLAIQCVLAIRDLHHIGWVHRDIKPSNVCVAPAARLHAGGGRGPGALVLIDFGLARRYRGDDGRLKAAKAKSGFHGTARYASLSTHEQRDMGRVDDLWPVFYLAAEAISGQLPWRSVSDKAAVAQMKRRATSLPPDHPSALINGERALHTIGTVRLTNGGRYAVRSINLLQKHLETLGFDSEPNYAYIVERLRADLASIGASDRTPMDWDNLTHDNYWPASAIDVTDAPLQLVSA